ncbi:MAG TPA: penicillin-binding transpeptidase domain-containing protein, partial [Methylophilaceae bacterium]|nr:penicillin-binding transpeptidase domain-containing protein [Methylophilaceae bacterium]
AEKDPAKIKLKAGAVIRIAQAGETWQITQLPQVESALIALNPVTGAVLALVGGFDFNRNKFNHVTQAWRQPGSSFKPFIYSAALEKGFTPASIIEDEPLYLSADETGSSTAWEPHNFDNSYDGPIRMRTALTKSKNMVSIRILQSIGVNYAQDYITRFGFSPKDHPAYLAMALGAGSVTPWQMAGGYAVFANGGYRVKPYLISKITDSQGKIIEQAKVSQAGKDAVRVIDSRNAFLMTSMMQDVVRIGTAARARQLGRSDLAGKTGTTNNQIDAWFAGYNPNHVAIVWIGYDQPKSLGNKETGGHVALPIWIDYMASALKAMPDVPYAIPDGISSYKIDPLTGTREKG